MPKKRPSDWDLVKLWQSKCNLIFSSNRYVNDEDFTSSTHVVHRANTNTSVALHEASVVSCLHGSGIGCWSHRQPLQSPAPPCGYRARRAKDWSLSAISPMMCSAMAKDAVAAGDGALRTKVTRG
jgi:hypothetical protein